MRSGKPMMNTEQLYASGKTLPCSFEEADMHSIQARPDSSSFLSRTLEHVGLLRDPSYCISLSSDPWSGRRFCVMQRGCKHYLPCMWRLSGSYSQPSTLAVVFLTQEIEINGWEMSADVPWIEGRLPSSLKLPVFGEGG